MNKIIKLSLVFCAFLWGSVSLSSTAQAQIASGAATTYNIAVNKVELCESAACSDPFELGSGATTFDISSASVGSAIGSYASLDSVPEGSTFTHIRVTMSRTIGIAGSTADPGGVGGTCGTDSGDATSNTTTPGVGIIGGGGTEQQLVVPDELAFAGGTQPPAGTYAANDLTLDGANMIFLVALPGAFTMGEKPPVIDVAFETATGLQSFNNVGACGMIPGPPVVDITVTE